MPDVRVEIRRGWPAAQKAKLLEAVHRAEIDALKIPEWDRVLRLAEYAPEDFLIPPGRSERYTRVEITMFPGRSLDAKRRLYRAIVSNLGSLGVPAADIKIVLLEPPMENWGIRGGLPASEVDLGFQVQV